MRPHPHTFTHIKCFFPNFFLGFLGIAGQMTQISQVSMHDSDLS